MGRIRSFADLFHNDVSHDPAEAMAFREMVHNVMVSRQEVWSKFLDPRRDIDDECGYPKGFIQPEYFATLYDTDPIAARVVEVMPKESWLYDPWVYEKESHKVKTPFEKAWRDLSRQVRSGSWHRDEQSSYIYELLCRADIQSGVGQYGVIFLGLNDGRPYNAPVQGMNESGSIPATVDPTVTQPAFPRNLRTYDLTVNQAQTKGRRLLYARVFPETLAKITQFEANPTSPRFGHPVMYQITFNDPREGQSAGVGLTTATMDVHWTRVVHLADNLASSEVFGRPRMRPVLPRILDLRKILGGSGEMYWRGAFPGLSIESHPTLGGDVEIDVSSTRSYMENYMNGLQRYFMLTGMSAKSLAPQVVEPTAQVDVQIAAICIKLGIPRRIFIGSERGELASSQDRSEWNSRVRAHQQRHTTPRVIVPFVDRLIQVGVLPAPADGYIVEWPDMTSTTDEEQARISVSKTQAMSQYVQGGVENLMDPVTFLTEIIGFTEEKAQSIVDAAAKAALNEEQLTTISPREQAAQDTELKKAELEIKKESAGGTQTPPGPPNRNGRPSLR